MNINTHTLFFNYILTYELADNRFSTIWDKAFCRDRRDGCRVNCVPHKDAGGDTQGLVHMKNAPVLSHTLSLTTASGLGLLGVKASYSAVHLGRFACFRLKEVRMGPCLVPLYTSTPLI